MAAKSAAGPDSAVARAAEHLPNLPRNVGDTERWLSLGLGTALLTNAALGRRFSLLSFLTGSALVCRAATGHCSGYQALGVSTAGGTGPNTAVAAGAGVKVEDSVTVDADPDTVYRIWRDLGRLPEFMGHLREVKETDRTHSRWTAEAPLGLSVQWDAEIVADRPGEVVSWKSLPGSDVDTAGSVHFRRSPTGHGTEVRVSLKYDPPAGKLGSQVARLFGDSPEQQLRDDLARFKSIVESRSGAAAPTAKR